MSAEFIKIQLTDRNVISEIKLPLLFLKNLISKGNILILYKTEKTENFKEIKIFVAHCFMCLSHIQLIFNF